MLNDLFGSFDWVRFDGTSGVNIPVSDEFFCDLFKNWGCDLGSIVNPLGGVYGD